MAKSKAELSAGNADAIGALLLADIVYWYRPTSLLDEATGEPLPPRKKFAADMFQASTAYYCNKFGFTKDQVRKALKRLEDAGYIRRELRTLTTKQGIKMNNVMYIEPVPLKIMEITHPSGDNDTLSPQSDRVSPQSDRVSPQGDRVSPQGDTYTETSTETFTETTTTTIAPENFEEAESERHGRASAAHSLAVEIHHSLKS